MNSLLRFGRIAAIALLAVAVVTGGVLVFVPQVRTLFTPAPAQTLTQPTPASFTMPQPTNPVSPLWPELVPATAPAAAALRARVPGLPSGAARTVSILVTDPASGRTLISRGAQPLIPASTMKLLTSVVALDVLDPAATVKTKVRSTGGGRLVLVGGGDPFLTTKRGTTGGSLAELADKTVAALPKGTRTVTLGYDAGLFAGPAWHPSWGPNYSYSVAPVSALMVDHGLNGTRPRVSDPAKVAAQAFAKALAKRGLRVTGAVAPARGRGTTLAAVDSPTLDEMVGLTLKNSDNDGAEHLLRLIAVAAGRPGSFAEGAKVVRQRLKALKLWSDGMRISDGSGLSRDNRVAPATLTRIVNRALTLPAARVLLDRLPVAGGTGTLWDRFDDRAEYAGRGVVRAKTGSLRDVSALAGYVVTKDGALLSFAIIANGVVRPFVTRDWIDRSLARIAGCGCG